MLGMLRKAVVVFYWIALPFAVWMCVGWLIGVLLVPSNANAWRTSLVSGLFAAAIGWRLWLNSRAMGGDLLQTTRLLFPILSRGCLAIFGMGLAALGVAWLAVGFHALISPDFAQHFRDAAWSPTLLVGAGALMAVVGIALTVPFRRSIRLRQQPPDSD